MKRPMSQISQIDPRIGAIEGEEPIYRFKKKSEEFALDRNGFVIQVLNSDGVIENYLADDALALMADYFLNPESRFHGKISSMQGRIDYITRQPAYSSFEVSETCKDFFRSPYVKCANSPLHTAILLNIMFFNELLFNPNFQLEGSINFGDAFARMASGRGIKPSDTYTTHMLHSYTQMAQRLISQFELNNVIPVTRGRMRQVAKFSIEDQSPENLTKLSVEMLAGLYYSSQGIESYKKLLKGFVEKIGIGQVGLRDLAKEGEVVGEVSYIDRLPFLPLQLPSSKHDGRGFIGDPRNFSLFKRFSKEITPPHPLPPLLPQIHLPPLDNDNLDRFVREASPRDALEDIEREEIEALSSKFSRPSAISIGSERSAFESIARGEKEALPPNQSSRPSAISIGSGRGAVEKR